MLRKYTAVTYRIHKYLFNTSWNLCRVLNTCLVWCMKCIDELDVNEYHSEYYDCCILMRLEFRISFYHAIINMLFYCNILTKTKLFVLIVHSIHHFNRTLVFN
jgi:hypothetical protein